MSSKVDPFRGQAKMISKSGPLPAPGPGFRNSSIAQLRNDSITQLLKYSITQLLKYSITQ